MTSKYDFNIMRRLWALLPLSTDHRQCIRGAFFTYFPFILNWTLNNRGRHNLKGFIANGFEKNDTVASSYVPLFGGEPLQNKLAKLICFYLPQFHPISENNAWWGEDFTEWSNVKPAQPQFVGHYQPHVPGELGYYNLLDPGIQLRQIELAKLYGIEGFCFYFYWFTGKRLLETPIQNYLKNNSLDLPFCLCWANENWSHRWDELYKDILIAQQYSPEDDIAFIQHVSQYMRDSRYIRIDNKPLLLVYRPCLLPSAKETTRRWRQWCRDQGIGEIYLAYTQAFEAVDPANFGFDAAIEFPPNNSSPPNVKDKIQPLHEDFACNVYDWNIFVDRSNHYKKPNYTLFRGVCPSWDNTARRNNKSSILLNSSPLGYQRWLFNAICETVERFSNPEQRFIFINAWNDWAEGAHLEPDQRYGYAYLEATRMALVRKAVANSLQIPEESLNKLIPFMVRQAHHERNQHLTVRPELVEGLDQIFPDGIHSIAVVVHAFYEDVFDEILSYLENITSTRLKLYVTTPIELCESIHRKLQSQQHEFLILPVNNRGRDILPFIKIMPEVLKDKHDLLIKVHTKKSVHREDGDLWRNDIFNKLLSEQAITSNIDYLANNPDVGILRPNWSHCSDELILRLKRGTNEATYSQNGR